MAKKKTWLNLLALSNEYERRARLAPALTSLLPLLPLTIALGGSLAGWGAILGGTTGVFVRRVASCTTGQGVVFNGAEGARTPDEILASNGVSGRARNPATQRLLYFDRVA